MMMTLEMLVKVLSNKIIWTVILSSMFILCPYRFKVVYKMYFIVII